MKLTKIIKHIIILIFIICLSLITGYYYRSKVTVVKPDYKDDYIRIKDSLELIRYNYVTIINSYNDSIKDYIYAIEQSELKRKITIKQYEEYIKNFLNPTIVTDDSVTLYITSKINDRRN